MADRLPLLSLAAAGALAALLAAGPVSGDTGAAPAPAGPHAGALAAFDLTDPNGEWPGGLLCVGPGGRAPRAVITAG